MRRTALVAVVVCGAVTVSMWAEIRRATPTRAARADTELASTITSIDTTGRLHWNADLNSVQTGVTVPGAISGLAADMPYGRDVLLAGRSASGGILEHWQLDAGTGLYVRKSAYTSTSADFTGVTYDNINDEIYLLDANLKVIWTNSWNGQSTLPTTGWTIWATTSQVPQLSEAAEQYLSVYQADAQSPVKIWLGYELAKNEGGMYAYLLVENGGSVTASLLESATWGADILAEATTASEAGNTVTVMAAENTAVELVDMGTQSVMGSATVPIGQTSVTVTTSSPFVMGAYYVARKSGTASPNEWNFRCMRRYGFPETYADGTTIKRIHHPHGNEINNPELMIVLPLEKNPAPTQPVDLIGNLAFAMRDPGSAQDPVIPAGNNVVLNTDIFLPIEGKLRPNGQGLVHGLLNIPDDPALVGQVMLFQFWMVDGGAIRLSEVVGVIIDGPPPTANCSSSARTKAVYRWTKALLATRKAVRAPALRKDVLRQR